MNILQVSTAHQGGGAAKVPCDLFQAYRRQGHRSMLAVGYLRGSDQADPDLFEIPNNRFRSWWSRLWYAIPTSLQRKQMRGETRVRNALLPLAEPHRALNRFRGYEDFDFPATRNLLNLAPAYPDIVHCHNLHGDYFDLTALSELSQRVPVVLTLHDMWLFTGHCAYAIDCDRWRIGCGRCPDLKTHPATPRDATAHNWQRKRDIFSRSHLYVATPCRWLMGCLGQSILEAVDYRVIPYGVDLSVFHPGDQHRARMALDLPQGARILLSVGSRTQENRYKDYATVESAIRTIAGEIIGKDDVIFVSLGGRRDRVSRIGRCEVRHYAFRGEQECVAKFYQAADVFLHAANADTFPNTVLESLACGLPVVGTSVGGIPEQVEDGSTGFLVPRGDVSGMASRVLHLLNDDSVRQAMAQRATDVARQRFDLARQTKDYLAWYQEIVGREAEGRCD
jgi:glycosyltransferase involved in cell wall biosynthesis